MRTFVLNLKRSFDRRKYMQELLKDFPYPWEFFEAVDGREIKNLSEVYNEKKAIHFYGKALTRGEVGCALSHLGIYKKMIDENIDKALILEDDIILEKYFLEELSVLDRKKLNNDILLIGQSDENIITKLWREKLDNNFALHRLANSGYGAYAYMIDMRAAEKLCALNFPVKMPADAWAFFSKFINIYVVEPNLVNPIGEKLTSNIDAIGMRDKHISVGFYEELKAQLSIFNFLVIMVRKTCSFVRIILRAIKNFFLSILPAKRIE